MRARDTRPATTERRAISANAPRRVVDGKRLCNVAGCDQRHEARGYCKQHYFQFWSHGDAHKRVRRLRNSGWRDRDGYWVVGRKRVHIAIAEKALGKPLPAGAVVHHVDGDEANNDPSNLVICQNQGYHLLLHRRQRAYDACGNANHILCKGCGKYAPPANLVPHFRLDSGAFTYRHKECR